MNLPRLRCRHCASFLTEHARRNGSDTCDAAACRHRARQDQENQRRTALAVTAIDAAQQQHPQVPPPQVVWLESGQRALVPVTDEDRQFLRTQIEAALAAGTVFPYPAPALNEAVPAASGRLCAQCAGSCCAYGAGAHGFIDSVVLQRWQDQHPGSTTQDAIDAYISMLPTEHVRYGCLFQTAQGCATPRELRADTCNHYACLALQQVRLMLHPGTQHAVVALTLDRAQLERAALITADSTQAIAGLGTSAHG